MRRLRIEKDEDENEGVRGEKGQQYSDKWVSGLEDGRTDGRTDI